MECLWKRLFPKLSLHTLNCSYTPPSFYKPHFPTVEILDWFQVSAYGTNCCSLILAGFFLTLKSLLKQHIITLESNKGSHYHLHCKLGNSETAGLQLSFLNTNWKNIHHEHSASSTEKHNCKVNNLLDWFNLTKCSSTRSKLEIPYAVEFVIAWAPCNKHYTWKLYCFSKWKFAFIGMS